MKAVESAEGSQRRGRGRPSDGRQPLEPDQIVEAALRAIRRVGPRVSMDDIAAEAGVTKPIIYRTVGDRSKIVLAVSAYLVAEVDRNTVGMYGDTPSIEAFRSAIRRFFEIIDRDRNLWIFVEMGRDSAHTEKLIDETAQFYVKSFATSRALADQPEWRRYTWAVASVGVLQATARMWTAAPYCDLDHVVDDVLTFIVNAHAAAPRVQPGT